MVHSDRKVPPNIHQQKQFMYKEDPPFSNYSDPNLSRITVLEDTQSTIEISEYSPQKKHEEEDHELWEVRTILSNSHHLVRFILVFEEFFQVLEVGHVTLPYAMRGFHTAHNCVKLILFRAVTKTYHLEK